MYTYIYMGTLTYSTNRIYLIKICLCCFVDTHLYCSNLSTMATFSPLIKLEILPACLCCYLNFILSHNSMGSKDKNIVFETLEAETIKPGDLSNFIRVLSQIDLLHCAFKSKFNSFAKSYFNFLSYKLARLAL